MNITSKELAAFFHTSPAEIAAIIEECPIEYFLEKFFVPHGYASDCTLYKIYPEGLMLLFRKMTKKFPMMPVIKPHYSYN